MLQLAHSHTCPHLEQSKEEAKPRRLRNRIDCSRFCRRSSIACVKRRERIDGCLLLANSWRRSITRIKGSWRSSTRAVKRASSYFPLRALWYLSREGVAEPSK